MTKAQEIEERLSWFKNNPIVSMWRKVNSNSYFDTLKRIDRLWKVPPCEYPYERVASTVELYLETLLKHVRYELRSPLRAGTKITPRELIMKFGMNYTEATHILNRLNRPWTKKDT